jgi:chromosome segregation ATPase
MKIDDIARLTAEKTQSRKKVQDLTDNINNIPRTEQDKYSQDEFDALQTQIQSMGDTYSRLDNAQRELSLLQEQKQLIESEKDAQDALYDNKSANLGGGPASPFKDTAQTMQLRQLKQDKMKQRSELQDRHDELQSRILRARDELDGGDDGGRKSGLTVSPSTAYLSGEFSRRLSRSDVMPENLQMVWKWSQETRLEDLLAEVDELMEHRTLLMNRRDSLQRKTEQLSALLNNYAEHIKKLKDVIQESQRAETE